MDTNLKTCHGLVRLRSTRKDPSRRRADGRKQPGEPWATYSLRYAKASTKACRRQRPSAAQARASLSHRPMPPLPTVTRH